MASRLFSRSALFGVALTLAGGCGLIASPNIFDSKVSGVGGSPVNNGSFTATGSGQGGGVAFGDGGGPDVNAAAPLFSYQYLCGSSSSICVPGGGTDLCAPGGNPIMGGPGLDASVLSCRLVSPDGGPIVAECGMGGGALEGDPCMSAADCAAELGCVASGTIHGICRNYCCASLESCQADTYCVKAPMADAPAIQIPVCIPAMKCVLLDDSTCPPGLTCTIVREDGTTSCVPPATAGMGTYGQPCPCAAGFTCSWANGTCLQLCHTGSTECGENGYCQGGLQPYPMGIGYCVWY
jgi:hypothetical protein